MSYDNGIEDEFKIRRQKLREYAEKTLTNDEIKELLKKDFRGKPLHLIADDREWTISVDFQAFATDPENNKIKRAKDATLAISGSVHMPLIAVSRSVAWLLAQANNCRTGELLEGRKAGRL